MSFIYELLGPYTFEAYSLILTFLENFICITLFARSLKKRKLFPIYTALSLVVGIVICFALAVMNTLSGDLWVRVLCYLTIALCNLAVTFICYHDSPENTLLSFCSGTAAQLLAGKLYPLIQNMLGINDRATISLFHDASVPFQEWEWLLFFAIHLFMYLLLSTLFRPRNTLNQDRKTTRNVIALSVATVLIVNVLFCIARIYEAESFVLNVMVKIFGIGFGLVVLLACAGILSQNEREQQFNILNQLWKQDRMQFESVKANMDVINMKCHDLKHIINKIEGKLSVDEIDSLRDAIQFYDANIKTGNEVLDVVLCEKAMVCQKKGIRFSCMADGKSLSFLTPVQTYTLFGNIIDNAVEAVQDLTVPDNKVISLVCQKTDGYLEIEESNYFNGELHLEDDLPATVKEDPSRHGFGIKSMKYIAEQYGGRLAVRVEDDMFFLNVRFPISKGK